MMREPTSGSELGNGCERSDPPERIMDDILVRAVRGESKRGTIAGSREDARHEEQTSSKLRDGVQLPVFREAQPLEPDDEVIREERAFGVERIRGEVVGRRAAEREVILQGSDDAFDLGPIAVEAERLVRGEVEVGNEDVVRVPIEREERKLRVFGCQREPTSEDDESLDPVPSVRSVPELRYREVAADGAVPLPRHQHFHRRGHLCNDGELDVVSA